MLVYLSQIIYGLFWPFWFSNVMSKGDFSALVRGLCGCGCGWSPHVKSTLQGICRNLFLVHLHPVNCLYKDCAQYITSRILVSARSSVYVFFYYSTVDAHVLMCHGLVTSVRMGARVWPCKLQIASRTMCLARVVFFWGHTVDWDEWMHVLLGAFHICSQPKTAWRISWNEHK